MSRLIYCLKLKQEEEGLDFLPYPGTIGQKIYEHISKKAWQSWLNHQTMLINENRLQLTNPQARAFLAVEMEKYFFGEGSQKPSGYVPPEGSK